MHEQRSFLHPYGKACAFGSIRIEKLGAALEAGDVKPAFEAAHSLKGVYANLSLTPVFDPMAELTEILRAGSLDGTAALFEAFKGKYAELEEMAAG